LQVTQALNVFIKDMGSVMESLKQRFRQFHLSTAIAVMLTASALLGVGVAVWDYYRYHPTPELLRIDTADPIAEARAAIARGDYHLIGIYGDGFHTPGMFTVADLKYRKYGVEGVNGTHEIIMCAEQARLQTKAEDYALAYNLIVIAKLKTLPEFSRP
jgi:hypothetical protein